MSELSGLDVLGNFAAQILVLNLSVIEKLLDMRKSTVCERKRVLKTFYLGHRHQGSIHLLLHSIWWVAALAY